MAIQKAGGLNPRDSLKSALYDKWQNQLLNQDFEQRTRLWSGNSRKTNNAGDAPRATAKKRKPRKTPSVSDGKVILLILAFSCTRKINRMLIPII